MVLTCRVAMARRYKGDQVWSVSPYDVPRSHFGRFST